MPVRAVQPFIPRSWALALTATVVTSPTPMLETMKIAMELALADADLPPSAIGYVNAHGTGTQHGDIAESQATANLFRQPCPN